MLRSTMQQLQDAQSQVATLQAAQAASADDTKRVSDELALVKQHAADDRSASEKSIAALKAQVAAQQAQIQQLTRTALAWKAVADRETASVRATESQRDLAARQAVFLQRSVDDLKTKNLALFSLGNEILDRFEKFSLGEQFEAKEPFIGLTRVRLENLIQDYGDKLLAQREVQ